VSSKGLLLLGAVQPFCGDGRARALHYCLLLQPLVVWSFHSGSPFIQSGAPRVASHTDSGVHTDSAEKQIQAQECTQTAWCGSRAEYKAVHAGFRDSSPCFRAAIHTSELPLEPVRVIMQTDCGVTQTSFPELTHTDLAVFIQILPPISHSMQVVVGAAGCRNRQSQPATRGPLHLTKQFHGLIIAGKVGGVGGDVRALSGRVVRGSSGGDVSKLSGGDVRCISACATLADLSLLAHI
jgi:hypothetical protein